MLAWGRVECERQRQTDGAAAAQDNPGAGEEAAGALVLSISSACIVAKELFDTAGRAAAGQAFHAAMLPLSLRILAVNQVRRSKLIASLTIARPQGDL